MDVNKFSTLTEALQELKLRGFTEEFSLEKSGAQSRETGKPFQPEEATVVEYHRFEGSSNPDDMSVVYALELNDGRKGTFIDAYGAYSNPFAADFIKRLRMKEGLR